METTMPGRAPRGPRPGRAVGRIAVGLLALGASLAGQPAEALNFVVNSTLDTADAGLNGVCDVGGGVCTLRAAIQEVNRPLNIPPHTITFAITPLGGVKTIAVNSTGLGALPTITQQVTIDGYTQSGASPNTLAVGSDAVLRIELDGSLVGAGVNGLTINAVNTTVRGLVINRFTDYGIQVLATGAVIRGNFVGTNVAGTAALGNSRGGAGIGGGIALSAGVTTVGGTAPADRNLVSGNTAGFARGIDTWNSSGHTIQGNYVGTNAAGTAAIPNGGAGIGLDGSAGAGSDNNLIGGAVAGAGNLISGGGTEGIYVSADSNNTTIQGNTIGLNAAGAAPLPNAVEGIKLQSPNNLVGGDTPAKGNLIAGNGTDGVRIEFAAATGNAILGNRIYGNGALGIDLNADGVTANDPLDADGGPNNRLNFPVISAVSVLGASLVVSFSLDVPAGSYRVEFFKNPSGVDVPNGEGEVFAGFQNVTHGGGGSRSFSATFPGVSGDRITATTTLCTDGGVCAAFSDTSEFGANLIATPTNYRSIGTAADSSTGSVNATNASQNVAGVGTSWLAINRGRGDVISICDQLFPTCTTSTNYTVLGVGSNTGLVLTTPYAGSTGNHGYTIRRQFTTLTAWEDCVDGPGGVACTYFPVASANLIADNRSEVGIAYDDAVGTDFAGGLVIDGAGTDASHTITLTADGDNRHYGLPGQGVLVNNGASATPAVSVFDDNVTVEWLEITGGGGTADGIRVNLLSPGAGSLVTLRNNLIRNVTGDGVGIYDADGRVDVVNNIIHGCSTGACSGIWLNSGSLVAGSRFRVLNNTVHANASGIAKAAGASAAATLLLRNNISTGSTAFPDYEADPADSVDPASSNNLDEDNSGGTGAGTHNPAGGRVTSTVAGVAFVNAGGGDFHIQPTSTGRNAGADLSGLFTGDIDAASRQAPWDIGADETVGTPLYRSVGITAAQLASGAANALTIAGSTATFASPLPANVGVGDAIPYDASGDGSIDSIAFIHGRTSSTSYTVKNAAGAAPTPVAGDTDWRLFRAYTSLANWEGLNENGNIDVAVRNFDTSTNLVSANTTMNVACYGDGADTTAVDVNGWTTAVDNYIRIYTPYLASEVGTSQRHSGTWNTTTAYRLQAALGPNSSVLWLRTNYVRVDGLQILLLNDVFYPAVVFMNGASGVSAYEISNNIVRGTGGAPSQPGRIGINVFDAGTAGSVAKIWNNLVYDFNGLQTDVAGILPDDPDFTSYVYNNTVVDNGQGIAQYAGTVVAKNNLAYNNSDNYNGTFAAASTHNLSGPGADPQTPPTSKRDGVTVTFVNAALDDFHLSGGDVGALNWGANLSADANLAVSLDIDHQNRVPAWDIGADDASGTTAVKLLSFEARPLDSAIALSWQTGSELDNLGFHVYRAPSEDGPWARLTASLVPGLGSSAVGRAYSFRDGGLRNGVRYFYRLEDVDAASKATSHGPVSAVPLAADADPESEAPGRSPGPKNGASSSCPAWVLAAHGPAAGSSAGAASIRCTRHGDPEAVSLGVLARDSRSATLELKTGGFYALHTQSGAGELAGTVRVFVPGFDFPRDEQAAALPIRRALVDAVVGRRVQLGGVRALDLVSFPGLLPSGLGKAEMQVDQDGTVRVTRRPSARSLRRFPKSELATLRPSLFQGERKSAVVELAPLRFEAERRRLVLARRVLVRLLFTGREAGESGRGSRGRAPRADKPDSGEMLARLYVARVGLHAISFEQLFPGRARGLAASQLRLERQGEPVSLHLEPAASGFGPGSRLYFYVERTASSTDFTAELAYELVRGAGGATMPLQASTPVGSPVAAAPSVSRTFEANRFYQPGLLEAPDPWLWEALASGATRVQSFALSGVSPSGDAALDVFLQGASESGQAVDHHVSVSVNGTPVGEAQFAGKLPYRVSLSLPPSLLREGANELSLTNVADTGVASLVLLDRFEVAHAQLPSLTSGLFEGAWAESGTATVSGLAGSAVLVDVSAPGGAQWLSGHQVLGGSLSFHAEAGHRYLAVTREALLEPRVASPATSTLRATTNQADYLLVAPRAFLAAAEPLIARRLDQGLAARAVAFEEIADEFGHGRPSAEAIRDFLAYAYQSWRQPSPRYVVLLGDATYDPRNFSGVSQPSPLPALWTKTSYLWTASDPLLAAVNGGDELPDLAIGRLPATTLEQAQALVEKLLAWEDSGQGLSGAGVLVADNPDAGGDFEANAQEIATGLLAGRSEVLRLRELGAATRPAIQAALDSGLSYLSYVGHGGAAVWASENVWNTWDAASLQAQSRQPLLLTLNCLNGYFVAPSYDSLAESLVKAEGRGAIAAFSPSGLSLDGPAHQYHRALMAELTSGRHERLGDAILAAQQAYVQAGLMPELVSIYQLLGDPAIRIR